MMCKFMFHEIVAASLFLCAVNTANSEIIVNLTGDPINGWAQVHHLGGNVYDVDLRAANWTSRGVFVIEATSAGDVLRRINVLEHNDEIHSTVVISIRGYPVFGTTPIGRIEETDVINPETTDFEITQIKISGDIGKPNTQTTFETWGIGIIECGGDWWADVHSIGNTSRTPRIRIGGDWLGGSFYRSATIREVETGFPNGDGIIQGTTQSPIEIWSEGTIESIRSGHIIDARIGNTAQYTGHSQVQDCDVQGHFISSAPMVMASLDSLIVENAYNADIEVETAMAADDVYDIGDSVGAGARFRFPQSGLAGQIIVNSNNNGGGWTPGAEVRVGPVGNDIVIDTPGYSVLSASVGGGAIGLVPFNMHAADCDPPDGTYEPQASGAPPRELLTIRHYGEVKDLSLTGKLPVTIERGYEYDPPFWTDISDDFTAEVDSNNKRDLIITAKSGTAGFFCPRRYRIKPVADKLICAGSPALEAIGVDVVSYEYNLRVGCKVDLSMNGYVDTPDPGGRRTRWT